MDLRSVQKPFKEKYRSEPEAARITLRAQGSQTATPMACSVDIGRALYQAEAHSGVGGAGSAACSGDLLLGALAACAQITCQMVATAMGIATNRIEVQVEGDLDLRGTLGISKEAPVGFEKIRVRFEIDAPDATEEQLKGLREKTEQYCVVMQTLTQPPVVQVDWSERAEVQDKLETDMRLLYGAYLYLRDNDMSEESNTSRLLQEHSHTYLVARLADELQELAGVQSGEHGHTGREDDTILEASQVGYWLMLLAATAHMLYDDFLPHASILSGYYEQYGEGKAIEQQQDCLSLLAANEPNTIIQGLHLGFALIGWACAEAKVSPLAPAEYDLEQMRRKGLVG
jgi:uncharacterized OsmC-like protein